MDRTISIKVAEKPVHGHVAEQVGGHVFPPTQWSMVLGASDGTHPEARAALESLCRQYWQPLYTFVRRQGRDHHDAEDATQQFIAQLLAADSLRRARPERGRFRTFLLTGLRNFLISEWRQNQAAKRGDGLAPVALSTGEVGNATTREPTDPTLTPEQAFDRSWARGLIERAVAESRGEYEANGRGRLFEAMAPLIWGADSNDAIAERAATLGLTANAFRVGLHRARRRLGERLRALIAETVADPREIDAELRHLIGAMSSGGAMG